MSLDKNKSEIVESFKNLLKKADEAQGTELENHNNIKKNNYDLNINETKVKAEKTIENTKEISTFNANERLGIKSIKRVPSNPFEKKNKRNNSDELEKYEYELNAKITNILNRHLYHWLNRELPKYTKIKLRKYIYELLSQLIK